MRDEYRTSGRNGADCGWRMPSSTPPPTSGPQPSGPPSASEPEPSGPPLGLVDRVNNYLLLVYAAACLLMNYSIAGFLYLKGLLPLSLVVPGLVSILLPLIMLSQRSQLGFIREFMLRPPAVATALATLVVAASCILPIEAFAGLFERRWPPSADYISFILSIKPKGPVSFAVTALGLAVVVPFTEELLFRGFVQRIFARNMSAPLAIVLAALLFGISHFNLPILPGVFALGILYGWLLHATGRLWCPVLAHAVFNFTSLLRLSGATEEEIASARVEMPGVPWILLSLAVCAASLWFLARLHRAPRGDA